MQRQSVLFSFAALVDPSDLPHLASGFPDLLSIAHQVVLVSRAAHRVFGKAEWVALQKKLQGWKANLKQVLGTLNKTQALAQP